MRQNGFHFFIALFCHFRGCQCHIIRVCQQPSFFCNGACSFFPVSRYHDNLDSGTLHFTDGILGFHSHIIPDTDDAYQGQVSFVGISISFCHGKQTHGTSRLFIHISIQISTFCQLFFHSVFIQIGTAPLQNFFRCTLNISNGRPILGNGNA